MILEDFDGTFVWSTNTSRKSVFGLKLTELGNLVLFDRHDTTVWQSFDHPTDSLIYWADVGSWAEAHLQHIRIQLESRLLAYMESNPSYLFFINYVKFENGSFNRQLIPAASTSSPQFMRLEPDGHLKVYQLGDSNWNVVVDLLTSQIRDGECGSPVTPIYCDHSQYHILLELKNTSYFNFNSKYTFSYNNIYYLDGKTELEDCKMSCLKIVCAKPLSLLLSLINNDGAVDNITVFLNVHKSQDTQYLNPYSPTDSPQKKSSHVKIILGPSLGAFFGVFFMVAFCFFLFTKKQESEEFDEFFVNQVLGMPTRFSYEELRAMTSNFDKKLGE
ncbi:hypothetical protein HYC85_015153 [Camellia sinensis]|uniref:Bulb-type lectin domain-containing protein n=1 Tax=Camellia sinensis TaxID=4442 RepID=A0A7J7HBP7_CAMSI|nr:hypothetical protein HYC85_015153 [Camellia sinensis]